MERASVASNEINQQADTLFALLQWLKNYKAQYPQALIEQIGEALLEPLTHATLILANLYDKGKNIVEHELLLPLVIEGLVLNVDLLIDYGYNQPLIKEMLFFIEERFIKDNTLKRYVEKQLLNAAQESQFGQQIKALKHFYLLKSHWRLAALTTYDNFCEVSERCQDASEIETTLTRLENEYLYTLTVKALEKRTLKPEDFALNRI